jgi:hypothetical protein
VLCYLACMRLHALFAAALLSATAVLAQGAPPPGPAPAAGQPKVGSHFAAAQRLYQRLDLEAALAELREAEVAAKDNEDELVQILVYRGLISADLGRTQEMTDLFKRALAMRPWTEMPPGTSPRVGKAFADARRELWGSANSVKPPVKSAATPASATPATAAPAAAPATPADAAAAPAVQQPPVTAPAAAPEPAPAAKQ